MCIIFLDVSMIKVPDHNVNAYANMRQVMDSKFQYIGHLIFYVGFKNAVTRCMKGEHSRLHKLYMS